ncbi:MAG: cytochrome c peroxidase [Cocleimonas sp.]
MKKIFFLLLIFINIQSAHAQNWTEAEIRKIQTFSLNSLPSPEDPSNKYLNDQGAINLGNTLFNDKRLSSNGNVSCSSCHIEKYAFTDNKKLAIGLREGFRNTSTLLNAAQHHWFFADGAKDSLWAQALSSIENPAEQNFTRMEMMRLISTDKNYRKQYQQIFFQKLPDQLQLNSLPSKAGPNAKLNDLIAWKKLNKVQRHQINRVFTNVGKSIAAFVSTIKPKSTRFDSFADELSSDVKNTHLSEPEQRGLRLFISQKSGCANCHSGPLLSNKTFHNIGTGIPGKDNGRSEVVESLVRDEFNCLSSYSDAKSKQCLELNYINRDKHQLTGAYKTSTLRSISKTGPYMHDGRFDNLSEVIKHYISESKKTPRNTDVSPLNLSEKDQVDLISFLLTL